MFCLRSATEMHRRPLQVQAEEKAADVAGTAPTEELAVTASSTMKEMQVRCAETSLVAGEQISKGACVPCAIISDTAC